MISNELAQQLKDAGFTQVWPKPDYMEINDAIKVSEIYDKYKKEAYEPTLSELIEACGDKFDSLKKMATKVFCAICFNVKNDKNIPWYLYVDHCHKTGKVRGLLCRDCNVSLGLMKENIDYLKNAILYLTK